MHAISWPKGFLAYTIYQQLVSITADYLISRFLCSMARRLNWLESERERERATFSWPKGFLASTIYEQLVSITADYF